MRRLVTNMLGVVAFAGCLASPSQGFGSAWRLVPVPGSGELGAIACASKNACTAVGDQVVERWNGRTWFRQTDFAPGTVRRGVACPTRRRCVVVGTHGGVAFAERWDGSHWLRQRMPRPPGATSSSLSGVSCSSVTACTAVGSFYRDPFSSQTLAERWNGKRWSIEPTPTDGSFTQSELEGVSCPSRTSCTAVGVRRFSIRPTFVPAVVALVERWNGARWSTQPVRTPARAIQTDLAGVSCVSTDVCVAVGVAVGRFTSDLTQSEPLVQRGNGSKWSVQLVNQPQSVLNGVSCAQRAACTAVGFGSNNLTLADRWNGSTWVAQPTPDLPSESPQYLQAIACVSTNTCTAVGFAGGTGIIGSTPLVEQFS
jgi:hypothetical protein